MRSTSRCSTRRRSSARRRSKTWWRRRTSPASRPAHFCSSWAHRHGPPILVRNGWGVAARRSRSSRSIRSWVCPMTWCTSSSRRTRMPIRMTGSSGRRQTRPSRTVRHSSRCSACGSSSRTRTRSSVRRWASTTPSTRVRSSTTTHGAPSRILRRWRLTGSRSLSMWHLTALSRRCRWQVSVRTASGMWSSMSRSDRSSGCPRG